MGGLKWRCVILGIRYFLVRILLILLYNQNQLIWINLIMRYNNDCILTYNLTIMGFRDIRDIMILGWVHNRENNQSNKNTLQWYTFYEKHTNYLNKNLFNFVVRSSLTTHVSLAIPHKLMGDGRVFNLRSVVLLRETSQSRWINHDPLTLAPSGPISHLCKMSRSLMGIWLADYEPQGFAKSEKFGSLRAFMTPIGHVEVFKQKHRFCWYIVYPDNENRSRCNIMMIT